MDQIKPAWEFVAARESTGSTWTFIQFGDGNPLDLGLEALAACDPGGGEWEIWSYRSVEVSAQEMIDMIFMGKSRYD